MPSHAYSTPNKHLRRSHSAITVGNPSKHYLTTKSFNPKSAHQHALLAANIAMERSRGSTSGSLSRQASTRSQVALNPWCNFCLRENSVPDQRHCQCELQLPHSQILDVGSNRPLQIPPAYESAILAKEFGAVGESYGAQPSSYRRLKRAKSLMNTKTLSGRTSVTANGQGPSDHTSVLQHVSSSMSLRAPSLKLRLRRSLQLLRLPKRRPVPSIPYQPELTCRPESIALARSEFLRMTATPQTSEASPRSLRSRMQSPGKSSRKDARSTESIPRTSQVCSAKDNKESPPSARRSLSASLRNKIRRTFGKSTAGSRSVPAQQLEASRRHFTEALEYPDCNKAFDSYCDDDPETCRRNSLYIPSAALAEDGDHDSDQLLKTGSTKSMGSLGSSSQSRLTSWTNSSISTLARVEKYEPKRLSVIREDGGPHQPSSSAGRHVGGISVFQQPLNLNKGAQIDSQRVYSALLKRIEHEQAEMGRTKMALEEIYEAREEAAADVEDVPTVWRVQSEPSLTGLSNCEETSSLKSVQSQSESREMSSSVLRRVPGQRQRRHQFQEQHSTFFGSSSTPERQEPSPFRKLLHKKRSFPENETSTIKTGGARAQRIVTYNRFGQSTESVYSRTTDGGTNFDYCRPVGSTDDFTASYMSKTEPPSMATILNTGHNQPEQSSDDPLEAVRSISMNPSEKGRWKGWFESQVARVLGENIDGKRHVRELAQVDPHDTEIGSLQPTTRAQHNTLARIGRDDQQTWIQHDSSGVTPNLQDQQTSVNRNPAERSLTMLHPYESNGAIKEDQVLTEPSEARDHDLNHKQSLFTKPQLTRKPSATHVARILGLKRSQPVLMSLKGTGKENDPDTGLNDTPSKMSDFYKSDLQPLVIREGLQESNTNIMRSGKLDGESSSVQSFELSERTPQERNKVMFASRLSRPFDMDVPEYNRPFDSMYLGKGERPSSETSRNARLSVASNVRPLRATKSYGGLGLPRPGRGTDNLTRADLDTEPTALPQLPEDDRQERVSSFSNLATNSKRIVSNFLRSRREKSKTTEALIESAPASSPAFI